MRHYIKKAPVKKIKKVQWIDQQPKKKQIKILKEDINKLIKQFKNIPKRLQQAKAQTLRTPIQRRSPIIAPSIPYPKAINRKPVFQSSLHPMQLREQRTLRHNTSPNFKAQAAQYLALSNLKLAHIFDEQGKNNPLTNY